MGQEDLRANISAISQAVQCQVTTDAVHGFSTGDYVRITDLSTYIKFTARTGGTPSTKVRTERGMAQLNDRRFRIVVDSTTTFLLQYPLTHEWVDSTGYDAYVEGGYSNFIATLFQYEDT